MKLLQNILTTIDFGDSIENIVKVSIFLAKKFNSQVTLMHVIREDSLSSDIKKIIQENYTSKLTEISNKIGAEGVAVSKLIIENGVPFEKIIQEAQNNDYNVIVAGSGNKKEGDLYKLGTTVEKLIRKNQIPLWVVKNEDIRDVKRIVCPVDFSDASQRALHNAITLADKFEAELTILNVFSPISLFSMRIEVDNSTENTLLKLKQEKDFHNFLEQFNLGNIHHKVEMPEGEPFVEILKYIERNSIDLLLIGTTGKTGLSRLLMGSVTEKVTREVPCSFISTKAKDITDNYFESNLKSIELILNSAKRSFKQKQYEKALEKYTIALKQYPDNIPIILGLIETNKALGNEGQESHYKEYAQEVVKRIWGKEFIGKLGF